MTKPVTHVRSIRLPAETWASLAARADESGSTVNALVAAAVDASLSPAVRATLPVEPVHALHIPKAEPIRTGDRVSGVITGVAVQLGPSRPTPGSRLKAKR